jgi:hypothetical protein
MFEIPDVMARAIEEFAGGMTDLGQ